LKNCVTKLQFPTHKDIEYLLLRLHNFAAVNAKEFCLVIVVHVRLQKFNRFDVQHDTAKFQIQLHTKQASLTVAVESISTAAVTVGVAGVPFTTIPCTFQPVVHKNIVRVLSTYTNLGVV
jgi:hypothetical protein